MNVPSTSNQPLPSDRAFIVQFHAAAGDGSVVFEGRVEHLNSGDVGYFSSSEELCVILDQLLTKQSKE
jgi:hypothetical protein